MRLMHNSMLGTSIVPTIINGGFRGVLILSEAEATLNIRAVPTRIRKALGHHPLEVIDDPAGSGLGLWAEVRRRNVPSSPEPPTLPNSKPGANTVASGGAHGRRTSGRNLTLQIVEYMWNPVIQVSPRNRKSNTIRAILKLLSYNTGDVWLATHKCGNSC